MNNTKDILRYIMLDMDEDELAQFRQLIDSNPEFREEYEEVVEIWNLIKRELQFGNIEESADRDVYIADILAAIDVEKYGNKKKPLKAEKLRKVVNSITDEKPKTKYYYSSGKNLSTRKYIAIALSLAAVVLFLLLPIRNISELAGDYYNSAQMKFSYSESVLSRSENLLAIQLFRNREYAAARKTLEPWNDTINVDPMEKFIYAICCYETGDIEIGMNMLEALINNDKSEIAYEAKWYAALILLKEERPEKAMFYLRLIESEEGPYKLKSKKLIRRIN